MKQIQKTCLILTVLLAAVQFVKAQTYVYSCDFENIADRNAWTLNQKPNNRPNMVLENNWYIGASGQFGTTGQYGLFVSNDAVNQTATYQSTGDMFATAYVDIPAMTASLQHTLRFDYRLAGSVSAKLDVWWVPQTVSPVSNLSAAPNYAGKGGIKLASGLFGTAAWKSFEVTFTASSNVPGRLVYIWISSAGTAFPPSACVDNIELMEGTPCAPPTNLTYNDRMSSFSWSGTAPQYEVCTYNQSNDQLTAITTANTNAIQLTFTAEGHYDLYVRSVCPDGSRSQWVSIPHFVWIPGARCIDYFDFGASLMNTGVCYTGSHSSSSSHSTLSFNNTPNKVDYGSSSPQSMHTLHTDLAEIDPNTTVNGGLRTVPIGEIASIRLGAYTSSGEDARIEYKYRVPQGQVALVDLQYACVLNSGGHSADNPFFQLEILDGRGNQIEGCTHAYFVADMSGTSGTGWHRENDIFWCDWRKVTFSLNRYGGQMLTIRLTASRCVFDTHFGYAYFTLNCRDGGLKGISCGDFSTDKFVAPSGDFTYRWFKQDDVNRQNVLSTDSIFHISANNDTVYVVEISNNVNGERCSYELVADPNPRFPIAQVKRDSISHRNCKNVVYYKNESYVAVINRNTHQPVPSETDTLDDVVWDFGGLDIVNSKDSFISFEFPAEGGQYIVTALASMSGGICDSLFVDTLNLPDLTQQDMVTFVELCNGEKYTYHHPAGNMVITENFTDTIFGKNQYGCEALQITNVIFHDTVRCTLKDTTICYGDTICLGGDCFDQLVSGNLYHPLRTTLGCDSLVILPVTVMPQVSPSIELTQMSETVMESTVEFKGSGWSYYTINGGEKQTESIIMGLNAGLYEVTFYNEIGCDSTTTFDLLAPCLRDLIFQRWNDVLSIKNEANQDPRMNGGRTLKFLSYQWKKDGVDIEGATKSYYYEQGGLTVGAHYTCAVMLEDSTFDETCPYIPAAQTRGVSVSPTRTATGQMIHVDAPEACTLLVYNTMGVLVGSIAIEAGDNYVMSPYSAGIYILNFQFADFAQQVRISVTE